MNEEQKPAPEKIVIPEEVERAAARYRKERGRHKEAAEDREIIGAWIRNNSFGGGMRRKLRPLSNAIGLDYTTLYGWVVNYGIDLGIKHHDERSPSGIHAKKKERAKKQNARDREKTTPVFTRSFVVASDTPVPSTKPEPTEIVPSATPDVAAVKPGKFILFVGDNDTLETAIKGLREIFNK